MKPLRDEIRYQVRNQVSEQLWGQVGYFILEQVRYQVLAYRIMRKVRNHVWRQVFIYYETI